MGTGGPASLVVVVYVVYVWLLCMLCGGCTFAHRPEMYTSTQSHATGAIGLINLGNELFMDEPQPFEVAAGEHPLAAIVASDMRAAAQYNIFDEAVSFSAAADAYERAGFVLAPGGVGLA
jgi:hypothetical protein